MTEIKTKQTCPHCRQVSGAEVIYGSIDTLSEAPHNALNDWELVLGVTYRKWDWEKN